MYTMTGIAQRSPSRLPWPAPALLCWLLAWATYAGAAACGAPPAAALLGGLVLAAWMAWRRADLSPWRRAFMAGGFPLSLLGSGLAAGVPAWAWLAPLALLLAAYPVKTWRDAPLYPTPPDALDGLAQQIDLVPDAAVLDAGCGMGHGLQALHRSWPQARIDGIEWSWLLRLVAAWRCPWARVRRGDMWRRHWLGYDLVYLFQRPESMPRAAAKARSEMAPGSWLVSLAFEVPGWVPDQVLRRPGARPVWVYRISEDGAAQSSAAAADNPGKSPARIGRP
jgi:hypothetical protein